MSTALLRPTTTAIIDSAEFIPREGSVQMDAGGVPYATATLTFPLLEDEVVEWLDPRNNVRVPFESGDVAGTQRPFDLGLRSRTIDHAAKTITLELASDEALLQDYAPLVDDTAPFPLASSLRAVVNYVLDKVIPGAVLEPGADDADVTPVWAVTNLMPNPSARAIVGNWIAGGVNGVLSRETGWSGSAIGGEDTTVTTAYLTTFTGNSGLGQGGSVSQTAGVVPYAPVQPGKTYTVYARVLSSVAKNVQLAAQIFGSDGAVLNGGAVLVPSQALPAGGATWTWIIGTVTTPVNAARLGPFVYAAAGTQWIAGNTFRSTKWMIHEGTYPVRVPWFDGATPADSTYTYVASGQAHASATTRTPITPGIEPDALVWQAGQTAWDFLVGLTSSVNLVLCCTELRQWYLRTPEGRSVDTLLSVSAFNASAGEDTIDRENTETWATGILVKYSWTDRDGISRTQFDTAGTDGRVVVIELDTAYPGPGAAAAILARRDGAGRVQNVTALTDWTATPGMQVQISLPGAPNTLGRVNAVSFDLTTSLMKVSAAGLIDVTPGDWAMVDPDANWVDFMTDATNWSDL